jgi:hypothetical protein
MDRLIGQFISDFPDALLVFTTALSQESYTGPVIRNYRPISFTTLLEFLKIEKARVAPVMSEEFHVDCDDEAAAIAAEQALLALEVDGERVFTTRRDGAGVFTGCAHLDPEVLEREVVDTRAGARRPFAELFYLIDGFRSGHHHPEGALWIRTGCGRIHEKPVSILDIAPTVLKLFGIDAPGSMRGAVLPVVNQPAAVARPPANTAPEAIPAQRLKVS